MVEKELLQFLSGEINVAKATVILARETLPNGAAHITVRIADKSDILVAEQWVSGRIKSDTPKHTGGKKPYIMLMVNEVEKLRAQGVSNVEEMVGVLACLGKYIEWNTGKLTRKRSKKPIKYKDLKAIFSYGNRKLNRILADLKEHDLLYYTDEGYFISTRIIKKGKTNKGGR